MVRTQILAFYYDSYGAVDWNQGAQFKSLSVLLVETVVISIVVIYFALWIFYQNILLVVNFFQQNCSSFVAYNIYYNYKDKLKFNEINLNRFKWMNNTLYIDTFPPTWSISLDKFEGIGREHERKHLNIIKNKIYILEIVNIFIASNLVFNIIKCTSI